MFQYRTMSDEAMGNRGSSHVDEVVEFRRLNPQETFEIPEIKENRKATDKGFLYAFIAVSVVVLALLAYSLAYADIRRLNLYDQCGNLCGYENKHYDDIACSGTDMTTKPYLKFEKKIWFNESAEEMLRERRKCVADCGTGYETFGHFCIYVNDHSSSHQKPSDEGQLLKDIGRDLGLIWWRIVCALLLTLIVTGLMLLVFRHALEAFVWGTLITLITLLAILCGFLFYYSTRVGADQRTGVLIMAGVIGIMVIVLFALLFFMRHKIKLVIKLLKEATKCVFAMPQLTLLPILLFLVKAIIVILFITTNIYLFTSGTLEKFIENFYIYEPNLAMLITLFLNFVLFIWALQFIAGLQYMIVSGAVSKWFFAKNKNYLDSPVTGSAAIAFTFHLGTIAFGSLVITLVIVVRIIVKSLTSNKTARAILDCILGMIEETIKFLSKNAYIITAMHGKGFWRSGKRATKLIVQNIVNIWALNSVGDFVLGMAQFLIVVVSMLLACLCFLNSDVEHAYIGYLIVAIFAVVIATSVFAVFETTVDSIFICFCEDMLLNDGMAKPYAMSKSLMEFIEESKKVLGEKEVPSQVQAV